MRRTFYDIIFIICSFKKKTIYIYLAIVCKYRYADVTLAAVDYLVSVSWYVWNR